MAAILQISLKHSLFSGKREGNSGTMVGVANFLFSENAGAAARWEFSLLSGNAVAASRPNTVHLTPGCARPLSPRRSSRRGERVGVRGRCLSGLRGYHRIRRCYLRDTTSRAVHAGTCPSPQPSPHREERRGEAARELPGRVNSVASRPDCGRVESRVVVVGWATPPGPASAGPNDRLHVPIVAAGGHGAKRAPLPTLRRPNRTGIRSENALARRAMATVA